MNSATPHRPIDGYAATAFGVSVVGCCPVGVPLGLMALRRIRRTGVRGRGLAIAALVLSGVWIVAATTATWWTVNRYGKPDSSTIGMCIAKLPPDPGTWISQVSVDCDAPHEGEVFGVVGMPQYGSSDSAESMQKCAALLHDYTKSSGRLSGSIPIYLWEPASWQWKSGDHTIECVAVSKPAREGSIKDSPAATGPVAGR